MTNIKGGWLLVLLTITCIGLAGCPGAIDLRKVIKSLEGA